MPDIQLLMLSTWSGRVATESRTCMSCRLMWWRGSGKGTVTCALLWMRYMILRPGCRGQRWGRYWRMWGWSEVKWLDRRGCGPAVDQWKVRTAKQLPDVSRTAVWDRAALCLAGAFCDWWGGNIEKLIRQITYC